jgi:hypothetical protein
MEIYFSDHFKVDSDELEKYGAFNISLVADLPLFIDPFLLFNSKKAKYRTLHDRIIDYLRFLRDKATDKTIQGGLLHSNRGSGLGHDFATALHANLHRLFSDFGDEKITRGSHLEKLCLIGDRVGKDNISDFTTNLVLEYLLDYTQVFAQKHIPKALRRVFTVNRVRFNYETETWERNRFELPFLKGDFVLLTPKDLLTRDETWINKTDLVDAFTELPPAISNQQLREEVNNYFRKMLPKKATCKDERAPSPTPPAIHCHAPEENLLAV